MTRTSANATSACPPADIIPRLNIVTLKWGSRYGSENVNRLYRATRKFGLSGSTFHCFTDEPEGLAEGINAAQLPPIDLPEQYRWMTWRKLSLFTSDFPIEGPCLYFDIDTVIVGPLEPLLVDWSGEPRFIETMVGRKTRRQRHHDGINSSMMLFTAHTCPEVIQTFESNKMQTLHNYPGDQGFVYSCLRHRCDFFPKSLCASFKKHCIPRFPLNFLAPPRPPRGVSVVLFHGHPDPEEVQHGYHARKLKHHCRPAPWVHDEP